MRSALGAVFGLVLLPATVRAENPMGYARTFGPAADPITTLGWGLGIISILVIVIIAVLLVGAVFRKREAVADKDQLAARSDTGGLSWIYIGVGVTSVVLAGCMIWTLITVNAVTRPLRLPTLTIQVTASQWWWAARYDNADPASIFTTANEIHIPVGQPVRFELVSADVIHSFWVPQLAGKMDVIPGQMNVTWLQANQPGIFRGQCAGFCGAQHAHMALLVIADKPEDFTTWQNNQLSASRTPDTADSVRGLQVFETHCAPCHTVRGVTPMGVRGPNLSHLMTRTTIGAGMLPNTRGDLAGWIANVQSLKPGAHMPNQILSGPELGEVVTYLNTLH